MFSLKRFQLAGLWTLRYKNDIYIRKFNEDATKALNLTFEILYKQR